MFMQCMKLEAVCASGAVGEGGGGGGWGFDGVLRLQAAPEEH